MFLKKLVAIFLAVWPYFCGTDSEDEVQCGVPPLNKEFNHFDFSLPEHRLVGGLETQPHAWPWTAQLVRKNGTALGHKCGSALIARDFVVTAAHCFVKSRNPARYLVFVGGHEIYSGTPHRILNISIHPFYNRLAPSAYDVALLRITPQVEYTDKVWPICLPALPAKTNGMCVVTGWGRIKENGTRASSLLEIHVPIMSPITCNDFRHYSGRMHYPSMICAGFNTGQVDSCQGDSGGPLQCQNAKNVWELQGIVSWGIGCANPRFPGVYTRMFVMAPWVRAEMLRLRTLYKQQRS